MENTGIFTQEDWSGGENTLLQPELLAENEASKIVNLLPNRDTAGLSLRKGFERIYNSLGTTVYEVFVKRMKSGTSYLFAVVQEENDIRLKRYGVLESTGVTTPSGTTVHTFVEVHPTAPPHTGAQTAPSWFRGVHFADWEDDKFFFSDGIHPLMVYNHRTGTCSEVTDKWSTLETKPKVYGVYPTQVKGRLAIVEDGTCTIKICGADDSMTGSDGLPVSRYESWSGSSAAAGGSVDVTPYGTNIKGIAPSYGGLVIFKEDGIYLWQWSDADAPWNASTSSIEKISMGVELTDQNTIVQYGSALYFLARNEKGKLGVFKFDSGEETELSTKIPAAMKKMVDSGSTDTKMYAVIVDGYYILMARSGGSSSVVAFFDLKTGAWVSISAPVSSCLHKPIGESFVLAAGASGILLKYPGKKWVDDTSTAISWELKGARLVLGDPLAEKYWRINWVDALVNKDTTLNMELLLDNGNKITSSSVTMAPNATHKWDEAGVDWNDVGLLWESPEYLNKYYLETGDRSYGATYRVWGTSTDWLRINRVAIGYRERRVRVANA